MICIGHNPNTNMLPMFHFLDWGNPLLEKVTAEPSGHNALLSTGQIDMAPVSAFAYAERWQEYAVLPDLSVSVRGRVGSILFFSKVPLAELQGRTVALTDQSATSVNLLKILLHRFLGVIPNYLTMPGDLPEMFTHADAALLIGDAAIRGFMNHPPCRIFDLGDLWLQHTGCSMTYAVWAFSRTLIDTKPDEVRAVNTLLMQAKQKALANLDQIVAASITMLGETPEFWRDYFSRFRYELSPDIIAGLEKYFALCYEMGLLPSRPVLNIWP